MSQAKTGSGKESLPAEGLSETTAAVDVLTAHDRREWLWTFGGVTGIETTNNMAERALSPAVMDLNLPIVTRSE